MILHEFVLNNYLDFPLISVVFMFCLYDWIRMGFNMFCSKHVWYHSFPSSSTEKLPWTILLIRAPTKSILVKFLLIIYLELLNFFFFHNI